jgi:hypothetical protein
MMEKIGLIQLSLSSILKGRGQRPQIKRLGSEGEKLIRLAALQICRIGTPGKNTQLREPRQQVMVEGPKQKTANDLTGQRDHGKLSILRAL